VTGKASQPESPGSAEAARRLEEQRAHSALLAHMRHELRTPLNAVIGYSEMLIEDAEADSPALVSDLQRIHAAGERLLTLVNDLLDPTQVHSAVEDFDLEAFSSNIRHELRTPLNHVIGYTEILLEDVLDQGEEAFVPELQKIRAAGQKLLGLLDDIISFAQMEAGLPTAEVAEDDVSSLARDAVETMRSLEAEAPAYTTSDQEAVLVVDDNEINRDLLSRRLMREGYRVETAANGRESLEMIRQHAFALVLLDVMMPEMNGYQVLQHLKADADLRHIPVVMVSALAEIDSVVRCIELGAEDYLTKPFNPVLLKARVNACLEKKRLRDREVLHLRRIEEERKRADELLHVILPPQIVEELKSTDTVRPRLYENVAVLFCDIVGFTPYCENREPEEVISSLQRLVEAYEELALRHHMQKIKTIGDSFMATAGLLETVANPALACVECGLEMVEIARALPTQWDVRVGIHVGSVMAGVVGHRQYLFDLWGDTVNTAARVESHAPEGAVAVSAAAWEQVSGRCYGESQGLVLVKGKGAMEMYRVRGLREG
jgi:adenylate cyclase